MLKFSNSQDFYFNTDENGRQVVLTVRYAMVKIDPVRSVDSMNSGVHSVGAFPPNSLSGLRSPGCIISFEQPELFATKYQQDIIIIVCVLLLEQGGPAKHAKSWLDDADADSGSE